MTSINFQIYDNREKIQFVEFSFEFKPTSKPPLKYTIQNFNVTGIDRPIFDKNIII